MAIFDDPSRELNRLQEELLEEEEELEEEYEEDFDEEYDEDYEEDEEEDSEEDPLPRPKSNRGLVLLALAELAGIGLIAAYWLRVIL